MLVQSRHSIVVCESLTRRRLVPLVLLEACDAPCARRQLANETSQRDHSLLFLLCAMIRISLFREPNPYTCKHTYVKKVVNMNTVIKANIYAISSDTHQLQFIKLHHFKQERF